MNTATEIAALLKSAQHLVFMTGAGVSTPSGIPDYRSMDGIYTKSGLKAPEYLLSHRAMQNDTAAFYQFIKQIYHPEAQPNVIHRVMAKLDATVITQNIDGLHKKAGSKNTIEFHGTIDQCHCEKCGATVTSSDFLKSYLHENCGGIVRPNVVLYDESIDQENIEQALTALKRADVIAIVGTSFKVYPFASLIDYANPQAKIIAINREPIALPEVFASFIGDASEVFELI